jgi:NinB protein
VDKLVLPLYNAQQAHNCLKQGWEFAKGLLLAGNKLVLEIKPMSKSREQEEKYHAMIGEIADQAAHLGSKWVADDWKRLLLDKFARETGRTHGSVIPNLDNSGVVQVGIQSRKFSKSDGIEFIEWLHAWGAENGVTFKDDGQ